MLVSFFFSLIVLVVYAVSNPLSPGYLKHKSLKDANAIIFNQDAHDAIAKFLQAQSTPQFNWTAKVLWTPRFFAYGSVAALIRFDSLPPAAFPFDSVTLGQAEFLSSNAVVLRAVPLGKVGELLQTQFHTYRHARTGAYGLGVASYTLPAEVQAHVLEMFTGTLHAVTVHHGKRKRANIPVTSYHSVPQQAQPAATKSRSRFWSNLADALGFSTVHAREPTASSPSPAIPRFMPMANTIPLATPAALRSVRIT